MEITLCISKYINECHGTVLPPVACGFNFETSVLHVFSVSQNPWFARHHVRLDETVKAVLFWVSALYSEVSVVHTSSIFRAEYIFARCVANS